MIQFNHIPNFEVKIWKKLEKTFYKLNFIWDKAKKVQNIEYFKADNIAKFIARQNITSPRSQEAPAALKWLFLFWAPPGF